MSVVARGLRRIAGGEARVVSLPVQNPSGDFGSGWGSGTASGAVVTGDSAMAHGDVYACVRVIADAVSTLPLIPYRRSADGRQRDPSSIAGRLVRNPSPVMTQSVLTGALAANLATAGNAFVVKYRGTRGEVVSLGLVCPSRVTIEVEANEPRFVIAPDGYREESFSGVLTRRDIIHVKAMSTDGVCGLSPIRQAREAIGLGMTLEQYAARIMGDGAFPAGVLQASTNLTPEQRKDLRESWNAMHRGPTRAGRPALLEGGVTYEPVGLPPEDAQFIEQRRLSATQIARIFRVPPYMIGADSGSSMTYANVEQASIQFVTYTLQPWLVAIEQAFNADEDLFDQSGDRYVEFLVDGLLRADTLTRYQAMQIATGSRAWITPNEARELENRARIDGADDLTPAAPAP